MSHPIVLVSKVLDSAIAPAKAHETDVGYDLYVAESKAIAGGQFDYVRTGVAIAMPKGYWASVVGRSSTPKNHGLLVLPGTVDTDYNGELMIQVWRIPNSAVRYPPIIEAGTRIAQLIFHPVVEMSWLDVKEIIPSLTRGAKGFGSSGI